MLRLVTSNLALKPLLVEYQRDNLWTLFYSCFILMTYLTAQKNYPFVYIFADTNMFYTSDNLHRLECAMN